MAFQIKVKANVLPQLARPSIILFPDISSISSPIMFSSLIAILKDARNMCSASGSLHLWCPLPGMLFHEISPWLTSSLYPSFCLILPYDRGVFLTTTFKMAFLSLPIPLYHFIFLYSILTTRLIFCAHFKTSSLVASPLPYVSSMRSGT